MKKLKNEIVSCYHDNWSIGIMRTNGYSIQVKSAIFPISFEVLLHNAASQDFRNLAELFTKAANELEDPNLKP